MFCCLIVVTVILPADSVISRFSDVFLFLTVSCIGNVIGVNCTVLSAS